MRGASRTSLALVLEDLEPRLTSGAGAIGNGLLEVVSVLDASTPLRRALADASVAAEAKAGIVSRVFASVDAGAREVVTSAVACRWASAQDMLTGLETAAVSAEAAAAEAAGRLQETEDQLFAFSGVVAGSHPLQRAFADLDATADAKRGLVAGLLEGKSTPEAVLLLSQAAAHPRSGTFLNAVEGYAEIVASRRARSVATVLVAAPLTPGQEQALSAKLDGIYGRALVLNVVVDRSVVGGMRVQVGDEVIDSTVHSRVGELRRRLAG